MIDCMNRQRAGSGMALADELFPNGVSGTAAVPIESSIEQQLRFRPSAEVIVTASGEPGVEAINNPNVANPAAPSADLAVIFNSSSRFAPESWPRAAPPVATREMRQRGVG